MAAYLKTSCETVSQRHCATLCRRVSVSSNSDSLLSLANALSSGEHREILGHLLPSLQSYRLGNFVQSYVAFDKFANAFLHEFRNSNSAWPLEALYAVCYQIRVLAQTADKDSAFHGNSSPEKLKAAGSLLMKVFGVVSSSKASKRVGALYVACQLFKTYFKLGTFNLCRSVIRSIETSQVFRFDEFPRRHRVTYMYYTGRLEALNENFLAADEKLSYALQHCKATREGNVRMILKYLIPVKFSLGLIPNDELLRNYKLPEYKTIVRALLKGDLGLLRHALQVHEDRFLRSGLYLVLEKLELQVYQRLVKKIYLRQKRSSDPACRAHQLKLDVIVKEVRCQGTDNIDLDEVECIVRNLIHKKLVKGYVAHKSKVVVLSKKDPFPKLNGKPVGF